LEQLHLPVRDLSTEALDPSTLPRAERETSPTRCNRRLHDQAGAARGEFVRAATAGR